MSEPYAPIASSHANEGMEWRFLIKAVLVVLGGFSLFALIVSG